jgi:hypothetical protein
VEIILYVAAVIVPLAPSCMGMQVFVGSQEACHKQLMSMCFVCLVGRKSVCKILDFNQACTASLWLNILLAL